MKSCNFCYKCGLFLESWEKIFFWINFWRVFGEKIFLWGEKILNLEKFVILSGVR